jgi:hypothetical protein
LTRRTPCSKIELETPSRFNQNTSRWSGHEMTFNRIL